MRTLKILSALVLLTILGACSSIKVATDYDTTTDFTKYKTFAFYKKGIDKVEISDLDKRRILKGIEAELIARGYTKSENPDLLVSIFAKSRQKVNVYNDNYMFGWGWYPFYYGPNSGVRIDEYTEGTLFIDFIDAEKKQLAWQGIGSGALNNYKSVEKKEAKMRQALQYLNKYFWTSHLKPNSLWVNFNKNQYLEVKIKIYSLFTPNFIIFTKCTFF